MEKSVLSLRIAPGLLYQIRKICLERSIKLTDFFTEVAEKEIAVNQTNSVGEGFASLKAKASFEPFDIDEELYGKDAHRHLGTHRLRQRKRAKT